MGQVLCKASRGYSIYEMDGRYLSANGPVDERVLVIRFIFYNPAGETDPRTDLLPRRWRWSTTWSLIASPRAWRRGRNLVSSISRAGTSHLEEEEDHE